MYLKIGIVLITYFKIDLSYWLLGVVTFKNGLWLEEIKLMNWMMSDVALSTWNYMAGFLEDDRQ